MDSKMRKELKGKAHALQPTVRIGKSGLTEQVVEERDSQLSKKHLIKRPRPPLKYLNRV